MRHPGIHQATTCFLSLVTVFSMATCSRNANESEDDGLWHPVCGLNESHSQDWAQMASNGVIGMVYFQKFDRNADEGTLFYKAVRVDGSEAVEPVADGRRLEIAVLLFDGESHPHVFVANSTPTDQTIVHYCKKETLGSETLGSGLKNKN